MTQRLHLFGVRRITDSKGRQQDLLSLKRCVGIVTSFHISPEEAGKVDALAARSEAGLTGTEVDGQHREPCFSHLAGHRALPDQLIDRQISAFQSCITRSPEAFTGRTDRLMSLLGIACLGAELTRSFAQVLLAVQVLNTTSGCADRLIRQV